jgi:hypothetical protein
MLALGNTATTSRMPSPSTSTTVTAEGSVRNDSSARAALKDTPAAVPVLASHTTLPTVLTDIPTTTSAISSPSMSPTAIAVQFDTSAFGTATVSYDGRDDPALPRFRKTRSPDAFSEADTRSGQPSRLTSTDTTAQRPMQT